MGRAIPVSFGDIQFSRKGDAKAFLKAMLNRYRPGEVVADEDAIVLRHALLRHPEAASKSGAGISGFEVHEAEYDTQCFWVRRVDGSLEKFSYQSCV